MVLYGTVSCVLHARINGYVTAQITHGYAAGQLIRARWIPVLDTYITVISKFEKLKPQNSYYETNETSNEKSNETSNSQTHSSPSMCDPDTRDGAHCVNMYRARRAPVSTYPQHTPTPQSIPRCPRHAIPAAKGHGGCRTVAFLTPRCVILATKGRLSV